MSKMPTIFYNKEKIVIQFSSNNCPLKLELRIYLIDFLYQTMNMTHKKDNNVY